MGDKFLTQSLTITELSAHPAHTARVLDWLYSTWSDDNDEFAVTMRPADDRPGALVALIGDTPVDVLAFKRYQARSQTKPELWIDALYVVPEHRRLGIGRKLVQFASELSIPKFANQLFVYSTNVPALYEGLGWEHLEFNTEFGSHTLRYQ